MSQSTDYYKAYHQQRQAREKAEMLLENIARQLQEANAALELADGKLQNIPTHLAKFKVFADSAEILCNLIDDPATTADELRNQATSMFGDEMRHDLFNVNTDITALLAESLSDVRKVAEVVKSLYSQAHKEKAESWGFDTGALIRSITTQFKSQLPFHHDQIKAYDWPSQVVVV